MPYFLEGPGEVRGRLRAVDGLPGLGHPAGWPTALGAALSLALIEGRLALSLQGEHANLISVPIAS